MKAEECNNLPNDRQIYVVIFKMAQMFFPWFLY